MAVKTQGTTFHVKNNGNFVQIAGIESTSPSGGEASTIDTTPIDATSSSSLAGPPSPQTIGLTIMYDPAETSHQILEAWKSNGQSTNFKVVYPFSGATNTKFWTGDVQSMPDLPSIERNSVLKKTVTVGVNNYRSSE